MRFYAPNQSQYKELQKHQHHNVVLHTVLTVTNEWDEEEEQYKSKGMIILTCKDHNSILLEIEKPL
jgi:hypothetical protein